MGRHRDRRSALLALRDQINICHFERNYLATAKWERNFHKLVLSGSAKSGLIHDLDIDQSTIFF
jgi:hypothetical protein